MIWAYTPIANLYSTVNLKRIPDDEPFYPKYSYYTFISWAKADDSTAVQKENIPERKYIKKKMTKYRLEELFSYLSSINFEDNFYLSVCNSKISCKFVSII